MRGVKAPDITELHRKLTQGLLDNRTVDLVTGSDTQVYDVIAEAASCEYDLDLKSVWLTKNRWSSLVRQYLNPVATERWLDMIGERLKPGKRGVSFMRTNDVASSGEGRIIRRRWGSCIIGFGYRAIPTPQLTMHSRMSYLGFIGRLDLGVAHVLAREIAARTGIDVSDIKFVWHLEAGAFHGYRCLSWMYSDDALREQLETYNFKSGNPTMDLAWRGRNLLTKLDDEGVLYGDMKYSSNLRRRRAFHTEVYGPEYGKPFEGGTYQKAPAMRQVAKPLPSVPLSSLDLSPLWRVKSPEEWEVSVVPARAKAAEMADFCDSEEMTIQFELKENL